MENRELDHLFKTGLETTATYHSAEEQWEVVAARLAQPSRRKPILWWLLGGGISIGLLFLFLLPKAAGSQPVIGAFQIPIATTIKPLAKGVAEKDVSADNAEEDVAPKANYLPRATEKSATVIARNREQGQNAIMSITDFGKEDVAGQTYEQGKGASMANSSAGFNAEPIIAKQESSNFSAVVKNIMMLPLREIASNAVVNTPLPAQQDLEKPPVVVRATVARWALELGAQQDFISSGRIAVDDARLQFYSAVAVNFLPHWQARLAYGMGKIERTITSDPGTYRIPIIDAPQEGDLPTATQLRYHNQNLEVQVAYHLPKLKNLAFSMYTGLQWNKDTELYAVYDYVGIYQPVTIEVTLPGTKLLLSDLTAGVNLRYPLTSMFSLRGGFQQYFSLNGSDAFRWPSRRRVHLGLNYQF